VRVLIATIALVLPVPACIIGAPPLRAGYGGSTQDTRTDEARALSTARERGPSGELRVAVNPTAVVAEPEKPRVRDYALGWMFNGVLDGPYAEAAWFVLHGPGWRVGPTALAEVVRRDRERVGAGGALGVYLEVFGGRPSSGCGDQGCSVSTGELGFGLALRAGARDLDGETIGFTTLSFEVRLPGFLAIILPDD
jgi:hypothetical protein